jgi:aminopeptidase N
MKFNTKSYILDRSNRKNRPIIHDYESLNQIEKSKDEMIYCKAPTIFRYLSYCVGHNVFFDMIKLFINKFRDGSASYKDFTNCIPQNITGDTKLLIEKHIKDIDYFYLKSKCPPVFSYYYKDENISFKDIYFERTKLENMSINSGSVFCDVKLFYSTGNHSNTPYKVQTFDKVEISNKEEVRKRLENANLNKPNLMLLNYNDYAYVTQIFTKQEIEWIKNNVNVNKE